MSKSIPAEFHDLFQKPTLGHLATLMEDGTPQVTPVWVDYDGTHILINTAKGRTKDLNMSKRPSVAIDIVDPENPFRYIAIRGQVIGILEDPDYEHADKLARRYLGCDNYPWRGVGQVRRIYRISPDNVNTMALVVGEE